MFSDNESDNIKGIRYSISHFYNYYAGQTSLEFYTYFINSSKSVLLRLATPLQLTSPSIRIM